MSTKHRYQVMPELSLEEYAALKADIDANGVKYPVHVDEMDNTLDGFHRGGSVRNWGLSVRRRSFVG